jgi:glutathione S-transferase
MILIGMFDSPFVRRVAVSMNLLGLGFEHRDWSVGRDFDSIRQYNPLGRVPTLVLDDGEALFDSAAILDYLDDWVGAERALLPCTGRDRYRALRIVATATGAAEKGVMQIYERVFRPEDKRHAPWVERCRTQTSGALTELERLAGGSPWLIGNRMTQADITATCAFTFLREALAITDAAASYPKLAAVAARCEAMPEFNTVHAPFFAPNG